MPYVPEDMNHAEMSYHTAWGKISLSWEKIKEKIIFRAEIPGAATADFVYREQKAQWNGGIYEVEL